MSWIDWIVFLGFITWVVWDGIRRAAKSRDMEGYFAGSRSIPWWAAGLSVMATQASAITVIGTSGQGFDGGLDFVQTYFGLPLAMVIRFRHAGRSSVVQPYRRRILHTIFPDRSHHGGSAA